MTTPGGLLNEHPAEIAGGGITTALGAVFLILEGLGIHLDPKVQVGAMTLAGWIALTVTRWRVAHRPRPRRRRRST